MAEILDANTAGIETDASGWTISANCTLARSTAQAHGGAASLAVTSVAAGDASVFAGLFPVVPGVFYRYSAWPRAAVTARWCYLFANWYDAGLSNVGNAAPGGVTSSASAWSQTGDTMLAPAGAVWCRPYLVFQPAAGSEVHYWDDISLKPQTDFSPIYKVADRASSNTGTGATTFDLALSGLTVGNYLIIRAAADNSGTNGAARTLTVSNQSGTAMGTHTEYQKLNDPGAASAGTQCDVSVIKIAATSGTIRFAYSGSVVAAIEAEEWTGIDATTPVVGTPVTANGVASTNLVAGTALTDASVAAGNMVYSAIAIEGPAADTITLDADVTGGRWFALTKVGGANATADLNQTTYAEFKIASVTGAQTSNPTINNARDSAGIILEFAASALQIVNPGVITAVVAMSTVTAPTTPGAIAATVAMPAVTVRTAPTPAAIGVVVAMPAASVPIVAMPASISAVVSMPAATVGITAKPSSIAAVVGMAASPSVVAPSLITAVVAIGATVPNATIDKVKLIDGTSSILLVDGASKLGLNSYTVSSAGTTVTPGAIAAVVSMPTATVGITAKPGTITAIASLPTAVVGVTAKPSTITAVVGVGAAVVALSALPGSITATVAMPTVVVPIRPSTITVVASLPGATVLRAPSTITAVVSMAAPVVAITAVAGAIAVIATLPTVSVQTSGGQTVLPATIAAVVGFGAPGVSITQPVASIVVVASIPSAAVSIKATPSAIAVVVAMPVPSVLRAPAAINAIVAMSAVKVAIIATPSAVAVIVAMPAATVSAPSTVAASTITVVASIPSAVVAIKATPSSIAVVVVLPTVTTTTSLVVAPSAIVALVALGAPLIAIAATPGSIDAVVLMPAAQAFEATVAMSTSIAVIVLIGEALVITKLHARAAAKRLLIVVHQGRIGVPEREAHTIVPTSDRMGSVPSRERWPIVPKGNRWNS